MHLRVDCESLFGACCHETTDVGTPQRVVLLARRCRSPFFSTLHHVHMQQSTHSDTHADVPHCPLAVHAGLVWMFGDRPGTVFVSNGRCRIDIQQ